ncbi:MAG: glycyl-radical enzyme activating protein [Treponema sp.]|jgi:pyruvate formate lyase activating enzyme|nr:glycyl-radical enzyme activating protein [Treponema sp.]
MSAKGLVFDIDRFSTHDGPGIRTAVFLKGCPLSCRWCHSPESQSPGTELLYQRMRCTGCGNCAAACPQKAISRDGEIIEGVAGVRVRREKCVRCYVCVDACHFRAIRKAGTEYSAAELIDSIKPDIPFFKNSGGGITVTGGEPLAQADFAFELLSGCRDLGIHTALETSGQGSGEKIREIAALCSLIYFDLKIMDRDMHRNWTGVSNDTILDNLRGLCMSAATARRITIRIPCIPGVNDSPENIRETAEFVRVLGIPAIQLMPYNAMAGEKYRWIGKPYALEKTEARGKMYYEELNKLIEVLGLRAVRE